MNCKLRKLRIYLILIIIAFNISVFSQIKSEESSWKKYSEKIDNGYTVQFEYPMYFKLDRIENCMCLGKSSKKDSYNNTMDWGIWMDDPQNYSEFDSIYYEKEFNNDFIIKKDSLIISGYKSVRTIVNQRSGEKYSESIIVKLKDCIFELINSKSESDDFKRFYTSIKIKQD